MKYKIYNSSIISILCFFLLIPFTALSSSDEGLQIDINKCSIQVRMDMNEFPAAYFDDKLYIDFFYVISFCKQNYSYLTNINSDLTLWLEYEGVNKENIVISYESNGKFIEVKRKDHLSLCNILVSEFNQPFIKEIKSIALGYIILYYIYINKDETVYDSTIDKIPESELYIGAIPGSYETEINGEPALVFVYFNKLEEKKYYINGTLYQDEKTITVTVDNFNKYLSGYLGIAE